MTLQLLARSAWALALAVFAASGTDVRSQSCSLTMDASGGGSLSPGNIAVAGSTVDPQLSVATGFNFVRLENSQLLVEYDVLPGTSPEQFAIRRFLHKPTNQDQVCAIGGCTQFDYFDADAGRTGLLSATVIDDGAAQKTVRLEWESQFGPPNIVHEVTIFANEPFIRIRYVDVQNGLNAVDLGRPGGSGGGEHVAFGHANWVRGYVTHTSTPVDSYYNRYAPDGINDPVDGGALNYNGHFIVGCFNPNNSVGFGRVMPVDDVSIVKLLLEPNTRRGTEWFPHPFRRTHDPFNGFLFAVDGGADEILVAGQQLAEGLTAGIGIGGEYSCGQVVPVVATPYSGWTFDSWSGALTSSNPSESLALVGNQSLSARFVMAPATYNEDFDAQPVGSGPAEWVDTLANNSLTVGDDFSIEDDGAGRYLSTASTATNLHSHYVAPGSDSLSGYEYRGRLRMTAPRSGIGVTFLSQFPSATGYYRLRRYHENSFRMSPFGTSISGGSTDTGVVPRDGVWYRFRILVQDTGTRTEIKANVWEDGRAEPTGWQVDCFDDSASRFVAGTVGVWSFSDGSKHWDELSVDVLQTQPVDLTVSTQGAGSGTVVVIPNQTQFVPGETATLTAQPDAGSTFSGWSGDLSGTQNPAVITMTSDTSVIANFAPVTLHTVTVSVDGNGSVTVDPLKSLYSLGEQVTLTANPAPGWLFSEWSGSHSGVDTPTVVTVNGDLSITARFVEGATFDDFEAYSVGDDPADWVDTAPNNSLTEQDDLRDAGQSGPRVPAQEHILARNPGPVEPVDELRGPT